MTPEMVTQLIEFFTEMIEKIKELFEQIGSLFGGDNAAGDNSATEVV